MSGLGSVDEVVLLHRGRTMLGQKNYELKP